MPQRGLWLTGSGHHSDAVVYMTGVTILIGGKVNAIIEQAAARTADPEAKASSERLLGESAKTRSAGAQSP